MRYLLKSAMNKLVILFCSIYSTNIYVNTISLCAGRFETRQPVYVQIDWNNKTVYINKFHTFIESVTAYGIVTGTYTNKLGINTFSINWSLSKSRHLYRSTAAIWPNNTYKLCSLKFQKIILRTLYT